MATSIDRLARRLYNLERRQKDAATKPQLADSSLDDGSIDAYDSATDSLQVSVGLQYDGSYTSASFNGATPPTPQTPLVTEVVDGLRVYWDGTYANALVAPMDFSHVTVHAIPTSQAASFDPVSPAYLVGRLPSAAGGEIYISLPPVEHLVFLVCWNDSGRFSEESIPGFGTPAQVVVPDGSDGIAPTEAPVVTLSPLGYDGVVMKWDKITNPDPVRYRVLFDSANPPVQQLTETGGVLAATSVLPDGTPLDRATTYYAQVVPFDADGDGPASNVASGGPIVIPADATSEDILVANQIFSREGYFGRVSAEQLDTGQLNAALAIIGGLSIGGNITMDEDNGIVIQTPQGETKFPSDGTNNILAGDIIAASLTLLGQLAIRGTSNEIARGAVVNLSTGSTPPVAGPSLTAVYDTHTIHEGFNPQGFVKRGTDRYVTVESIFDAVLQETSVDVSGNYVLAFGDGWGLAYEGGRTEVQNGQGGLTIIGDHAYVLCRTDEFIPGTSNAEWYIYKLLFNGGTGAGRWSYVTRWKYRPGDTGAQDSAALGGNSPYLPTIGTDGAGNIAVVQPRSINANVWYTRYSTAGVQLDRMVLTDTGGGAFSRTQDAHSLVVTEADVFENQIYIQFAGGKRIFAFDPDTGARDEGLEFDAPATNPRGLLWDGTRFKMRTWDTVIDFTNIHRSNGPYMSVSAVTTWRKANGTAPAYAQYETGPSPASRLANFPCRASVQITTAPIPDDPGDTDDADSISVYMVETTATAPYPYPITWYERQPVPAVGVRTVRHGTIEGGTGQTPPEETTFPDATPGQLRSITGDGNGAIIRLEGSGAGRVGPLRWSANGEEDPLYPLPPPTSTGSNGTASSSDTGVRDDVLGTYTFTARAGRRYRVCYDGVAMNSNQANTRWSTIVRYTMDGTTPDNNSAVATVGFASPSSTGISGRETFACYGTFVPGAGTCKLAAFTRRDTGTGTGTPISAGNARELYVVDIGPA